MSLHFRLEDLNENQRKQVERQICGKPFKAPKNIQDAVRKTTNSVSGEQQGARPTMEDYKPHSVSRVPIIDLRKDKMSKTEIEFNEQILHGLGRFEALTLKLEGGSRYTPDFLYFDDGVPVLAEVKGSYRLQSEGRAHTAFLEAASQFSSIFKFVWATKLKKGSWDMKYAICNR